MEKVIFTEEIRVHALDDEWRADGGHPSHPMAMFFSAASCGQVDYLVRIRLYCIHLSLKKIKMLLFNPLRLGRWYPV